MEKQNSNDESVLNANREHKASVFSLLFSNPLVLRELYSAIEGIELPPDIPISINTLSNVLHKGKINDLSFLIDNRLVIIIEHQSTINENMPVRLLIYIAEIYKKILERKNIFQEKLLCVPAPEFIVLYNVTKPYDDHKELKLSDAFKDIEGLKTTDNTSSPLELVVQVYNINKGHNSHILEKSKNLDGYSIFIDKIREYKNNGATLEESLKNAVKYCLENDILADFLNIYKSEVMNMILEDLTIDEWLEVRYEDGLEQGRVEGRLERDQYILDLISQGFSAEQIKHHLVEINTTG